MNSSFSKAGGGGIKPMGFCMGDTIVSYQKTGRVTTANSTFSDKKSCHAGIRGTAAFQPEARIWFQCPL
jgi:hypothetical protein